MPYGSGDDYQWYCEKINKMRGIFAVSKHAIMDAIINSSDIDADEKLRLLGDLSDIMKET